VPSTGHITETGNGSVGVVIGWGVGTRVGFLVGERVGLLVGGRVGLVGERVGLNVGIRVGLSVMAPFTMANDTRYVVPTCPFTAAETAWVPTLSFVHGLYDFPPQRV
jgi:hypothetical protein